MTARAGQTVQSRSAALPHHRGVRAATSPGRAREALLSSLSRELRWSVGEDDRFVLLDGAWQSVLGWRPERLRGWHWEELVHPEDRRRAGEVMERLRADGGEERDLEIRLALATGGHRRTSWTLVAGSGPDRVLGVGHDRTVQTDGDAAESGLQRRNAALAARLAELEKRYTAVERFAGTAAHQLAEPLVIAESSAILVAEELGPHLDPMLRSRLDAIGRGAARARRLMDALLADARTEDPGGLETREVDLGAVVAETVTSLEHQVEERAATVTVGPLPSVLGDPGLLSVVIENLLSNALKYGPRSGGRVEISADRHPEGWRVSVAGEGTPIPASEAGRIFQPFHRIAGERRVPGMGLGLTICTRLVDRLGGTIGVDPGTGSGNTFWLILPAA